MNPAAVGRRPVTAGTYLFGDWRDEVWLDSIAMALVEERKCSRAEREDALAPLRLEVAELMRNSATSSSSQL